MPLVPFCLTLSKGNSHKVNGRIVSGYRLQYTSIRGVSLQIYSASNFGFGRGLIAGAVANSGNCMIPRGMAVLDTMQYFIFGPISILINILVWIFFILGGIVSLPFWFCFPAAIKAFQLLAWLSVITMPITLLLNIVAFIINPLQILAPEFFALIKYHQWDTGLKAEDLI